MIRITKSEEPSSLAAYRRVKNATFKDMPNNVKDDLRQSLINEQGGLCCYCMRRVPAGDTKFPGMKIEHFKCQDHNKNDQLVYRNLFAACWGGELDKDELQHTCDTKKRNSDITTFNLLTTDFDRVIRYLEDGTIHATDEGIDEEMNSILNLNNQSLRNRRQAVRKAVSDTLRRLHAKGKVKQGKIQNLIISYAEPYAEEKNHEFYPVAVYYLQNKLKHF